MPWDSSAVTAADFTHRCANREDRMMEDRNVVCKSNNTKLVFVITSALFVLHVHLNYEAVTLKLDKPHTDQCFWH